VRRGECDAANSARRNRRTSLVFWVLLLRHDVRRTKYWDFISIVLATTWNGVHTRCAIALGWRLKYVRRRRRLTLETVLLSHGRGSIDDIHYSRTP